MLAVVLADTGRMETREVPDPRPQPGQALVRVAAAGVCGTDHHIVQGTYPARLPRILGHEVTGVVEALAGGSDRVQVGDLVAVDPNIPCYACDQCLAGRVHLCRHRQAVGVDRDGGFAERLVVPAGQLHRLVPGLRPEHGALVEPVSCCLRGIDRVGAFAGTRAAVAGLGAIGLLLGQLLRLQGVTRVTGIDPVPARRELAARLGFEVLDPAAGWPLPANPREEGIYDLVVDAVGSAEVLNWAVQAVAPGGKVLVFGVAPPEAEVAWSPYLLYRKEVTVVSAYTNPFTMARAAELVNARALALDPLLTDPVTLAGLPEVFAPGYRPRGIKTYVRFSEG